MFRSIANAFVALNGTKRKSKKKKRNDGSSSKDTDGPVSRSTRDAMSYLKKYSKRDKRGDVDKGTKEGEALLLEEYYWDLDSVDMFILLEIVYAKHNSDLLDKIHVILSKFEGEEILLLQQLCQRYSITYDDMRENINKTRIAAERKEKNKNKSKDGNKNNGRYETEEENGDDENKNGYEDNSDDGIDIVDDASTVDGNAIARGRGASKGESASENKNVLSRSNNHMMNNVMSQLTNTLQKPKHVQPPPPPPNPNPNPFSQSDNKPPPPPHPALNPSPNYNTSVDGAQLNSESNNNTYSYNPAPSSSSIPQMGVSLYEQNKRDVENKRKDKEIEILRNELEFAKLKLEESNRETKEMLKALSLLSESTRQLSNSSLNGSSVYSRDPQDGPESYAPFTPHNRNDNNNNNNNNNSSSKTNNTVVGNEVLKNELEVMKSELKETRKFLTQLANDVNFSSKMPVAEYSSAVHNGSAGDYSTPYAPKSSPGKGVKNESTVADLFNNTRPDTARNSLTVVNTATNSASTSPKREQARDDDNWCELYDPKSQRKYYYNTSTRRSVWQMPSSDASTTITVSGSGNRRSSSAPRSSVAASPHSQRTGPATPYTADPMGSGPSPQQTPLGFPPLNWGDNTAHLSPIYRSTSPARGKSTNEKGRFAPVSTRAAPKIVPKIEVHRTLYDKSWVAAVDPRTLRKYYYNRLTKESVWKRPPGFESQ